jgi:hypothetical protein
LPRARDHLGRVTGRSASIISRMMVVNDVPPSRWSWGGQRRLLTTPVGLALDDEFQGGGLEPVDHARSPRGLRAARPASTTSRAGSQPMWPHATILSSRSPGPGCAPSTLLCDTLANPQSALTVRTAGSSLSRAEPRPPPRCSEMAGPGIQRCPSGRPPRWKLNLGRTRRVVDESRREGSWMSRDGKGRG